MCCIQSELQNVQQPALLLFSYHNCVVVVIVVVVVVVVVLVVVVLVVAVVVFGSAKYKCLLSSPLCFYLTISST